MIQSWKEQLQQALIKKLGSGDQSNRLFSKYQNAFHTSYQEDTLPDLAVIDILQLEQLTEEKPFEIDLYQLTEKNEQSLYLKLFQFGDAMPLSDILPMLENMDFRVLTEHPYEVRINGINYWISEFKVIYVRNKQVDIVQLKPLFQDAFAKILFGVCENDGFNKLVINAGLNWQEIVILRAYAKYLQQTQAHFSQAYMEETVVEYAAISKNLVQLFKLRFDSKHKKLIKEMDALEKNIIESLDAITSLEQDRIMRYLLLLIKATLRTNYNDLITDVKKDYISFKLQSDLVPELPLPLPLYEIFVYSRRFYGIHLRSAKVARGGIRWSDRREDLRTEILGLMKAQKVKNAVIVPSGAKGGFVLKVQPASLDKRNLENEIVNCYKLFIRGLLDLTDNIKGDKIVHPENIVCYDDFDPYLVVAADKGTGTFSDIANEISKEYSFWLGDAFASGGSAGYNHKEMGITARGAWESIRRHFFELDLNVDETDFTVVGIGDMSGDVFGNGMLYTNHIKLVAAFDHRDIFIDPSPDTAKSFEERLRLFKLPRSSWQDYNPQLISAGGGIFSRKLKAITITPEMKKVFAIEANTLTPNELVRMLLKAPVDLLYNGGIGTYVKAGYESNEMVGDRANDFCRINGSELRCRVVAEGGNLGCTQLGRIEYAMQGGLINTDFIDNSAGVDCSDHEVNIKILLDQVVKDKKLTEEQRNVLLQKMQDDIARHVLRDNFMQAQTISMSAARITHYAGLYQNYISELEAEGEVDRAVEFLPDDKTILERKAAGLGITRPEIAVLLAYSKIYVEKELLKSDLPEDPYFARLIEIAFPVTLKDSYLEYMHKHKLRREIIATLLSNKVINEMGVTFIYREQAEVGATVPEIIRAYTLSSKIFETAKLATIIETFPFKVSVKLRYDLLHHIRHLLNLATRWFLRSDYLGKDIDQTIKHFSVPIKQLEPMVASLMSGMTKAYLESLIEHFITAGIPKETAARIATYRAIYILLNVIEVATQHDLDLIKTAKMYFHVGAKFSFVWFRDHIANDTREGHWNNLARLTLRDQLDILQKYLTVVIMRNGKQSASVVTMIDHWMEKNTRAVERWEKMLQLLHGSSTIDYSMFFVALRELSDWVHAI